MNIGFIGLGPLGEPIAGNLMAWCRDHGCHLYVWDPSAEAMSRLVKSGARHGQDPASIAQRCTVLLSVLPAPEDVSALALGENGVLDNADGLDIWIELSPFYNARWEQFIDAVPEGLIMVDAPVKGSIEAAEEGTLTVEFEGQSQVFHRYKNLLEAFSIHSTLIKPENSR